MQFPADILSDDQIKALADAGYAVVPREPCLIMAMRGYQAGPVFDDADYVFDWVDMTEAPYVKGWSAENKLQDDERGHLVAAEAYRGAIRGWEEWCERRRREGDSDFIAAWFKPVKASTAPI